MVLVQRREGIHAIRAMAHVVEGVASDAQRLLVARCQLGLLLDAADVHGKGLALRPDDLVISTIRIS